MRTSAATGSLPRSGIRQIMELAWEVPDAIHLEVGEPNFPTPGHIWRLPDSPSTHQTPG